MTERYQCSAASTQRAEPLMATGSQVRGWLLVEVRGSWGFDAVHDSELGAHVPASFKDDMRRRGIRVVCIRQQQRRDQLAVQLYFVTVHRPPGQGVVLGRTVQSLSEVVSVAKALDRTQAPPQGWVELPDRLALVCTNGRHDQCCANHGRPVVRALRESAWSDRAWESSHVGGDRFAANVVVLPDSLYFGRCQPGTVEALLDGVERGRLDLAHFRGRSSLSWPEQAAEHTVRTRLGLTGLDDVIVTTERPSTAGPMGSGVTRCRVEISRSREAGSYLVDVERSWQVIAQPVTCGGTPNQRMPVFTVGPLTPDSPPR